MLNKYYFRDQAFTQIYKLKTNTMTLVQKTKTSLLIVNFLILVLILQSCKSTKSTANSNVDMKKDQEQELVIANKTLHKAYSDSARSWDALKKEHNNSYEYVISEASFSGWSSELKTTVTNGAVSKREYWETKYVEGAGFGPLEKVYTEIHREIGRNKKGGRPATFDKIYIDCARFSLIVDENMNDISFTTDDSGILTACGFTPKNCADDCYRGVSIQSFKWLE